MAGRCRETPGISRSIPGSSAEQGPHRLPDSARRFVLEVVKGGECIWGRVMLPCPSPDLKRSFVFPPTISLPGMELSQSSGVRGQRAAETSVQNWNANVYCSAAAMLSVSISWCHEHGRVNHAVPTSQQSQHTQQSCTSATGGSNVSKMLNKHQHLLQGSFIFISAPLKRTQGVSLRQSLSGLWVRTCLGTLNLKTSVLCSAGEKKCFFLFCVFRICSSK